MAGNNSGEVAAEGIREDEKLQGGDEIDIDALIEIIREGFDHFKTNEFDKLPEYFEQLAGGQQPKFLVFACSDSRVCPSRVLNFQLGQAFMARNIANLVPRFDKVRYSGSGAVIEYAITTLQVEVILVIGHSKCGGIEALMTLSNDGDAAHSSDFVHDWIKIGLPAKATVMAEHGDEPLDEQRRICEKEAVNVSLINLLTYPYVRSRVAKGTLKLMGGHYDFVEGKLEVWGFDVRVKPLLSI